MVGEVVGEGNFVKELVMDVVSFAVLLGVVVVLVVFFAVVLVTYDSQGRSGRFR